MPPPLLNTAFSKFKIGHFGVPIPSADDLNYQTFCTRDVTQISASSQTISQLARGGQGGFRHHLSVHT